MKDTIMFAILNECSKSVDVNNSPVQKEDTFMFPILNGYLTSVDVNDKELLSIVS